MWPFHELTARPQSHLSLATTPPCRLLRLCAGWPWLRLLSIVHPSQIRSANAGEQLAVVRSPGRFCGHRCQRSGMQTGEWRVEGAVLPTVEMLRLSPFLPSLSHP